MRRPSILCVLFALVVALPAGAQDVVRLKSGETLAGTVTDGMLEVRVATAGGEVRVPWRDIEAVDRGEFVRAQYRERAAGLSPTDADSHFLLALWCRRHGLEAEMQAELSAVLEAEPEHAGARAARGQEKVGEKWVAGESMLEAKGFVRRGDRWVLREEAAWAEMAEARDRPLSAPEGAAADLLAKAVDENERVRRFAAEALAGRPFDDVRLPLYRALGGRDPAVRAFAAAELGRRREEEAVRPLLRSAILDTSETVRDAAVDALAAIRAPGTLLPLCRALASTRPAVRMNAAAAMGRYGDVRGIEYLVRTLGMNWGPGQRNNMSVMNQVSYIQDFDVEIAQAAQIGDPIVQVLREGVILDFAVLGASREMTVVERRVVRSALARLAGQDLGDDAAAWSAWWEGNRERLLAEAK